MTRRSDAGRALAALLPALLAASGVMAREPPPPPVEPGADQPVELAEEITVTAGHGERRIQDVPLRVEVVDREEIEEKALMPPGSVAMLLGETTGLRVQTTAPSTSAANVRIQGLRGRYSLLLWMVRIEPGPGRAHRVLDLVEKPRPAEAPSDLGIIGRYILPPEIVTHLDRTAVDGRGEIQLTDALKSLLAEQRILAYEFEGIRYDTGHKLGFLKATIECALRRSDVGPEFRAWLRTLRLD